MVELLLRDHLIRLLAFACLSLAASVIGLVWGNRSEFSKGFWLMTLAWSAVNLVIIAASLAGQPPTLAPFREFLAFNLGLNLAYMGVGMTVGKLAKSEFSRGLGWAVVPQGLALLILDGILMAQLPPVGGPP